MIKFADDYFNELKVGSKLVFAGDPETDFLTRKDNYKVDHDQEGFFIVDDDNEALLIDILTASMFIIDDN